MLQFLDTNVWWLAGLTVFFIAATFINMLVGACSGMSNFSFRRLAVLHLLLSLCAIVSAVGFAVGLAINVIHYIKSTQ